MMDENYAARMEADAEAFRGLSADFAKLADAAGDGREALRKIDETHSLRKGAAHPAIASLGQVETEARKLAVRLDRLAAQPVPSWQSPRTGRST